MPFARYFHPRTILTVLPAFAVFCFVIFVHHEASGQKSVVEPFVLVGPDAQALITALEPRISAGPKGHTANVVVVFPASPSTAYLVLVNTSALQKFWTVIPLSVLAEIMQQMGAPA